MRYPVSNAAFRYWSDFAMIVLLPLWIPCPRTNTPRENVETPSVFQTSFLETMLGELGRLSCLEPRHGPFSTFRQRILCGGYIA